MPVMCPALVQPNEKPTGHIFFAIHLQRLPILYQQNMLAKMLTFHSFSGATGCRGWAPHVLGHISNTDVDVDHLGMTGNDAIAQIAAALDRRMERTHPDTTVDAVPVSHSD